jgi:hypothetical protein
MKTYTFELVIKEGNDEFWEEISNKNVSGCEEVEDLVADALASVGFYTDNDIDAAANTSLKLINFNNN